jgi:hypothetical protein
MALLHIDTLLTHGGGGINLLDALNHVVHLFSCIVLQLDYLQIWNVFYKNCAGRIRIYVVNKYLQMWLIELWIYFLNNSIEVRHYFLITQTILL